MMSRLAGRRRGSNLDGRSDTHPLPAATDEMGASRHVESPWSLDAESVLERLGVQAETGLDASEVAARRARHGPNQLQDTRHNNALTILLRQFSSVVIALLLVAAFVSGIFGNPLECLAILGVVVLNTAIGFATELHAVRSIEALRELSHVDTTVRRDGAVARVAAEALVPGDIVLVDSGDLVTADLRLVEASQLEADESTLTGESMPVTKHCKALDADTHLSERANQLFKGTSITRGSGVAVVTGTGFETELGRTTHLVLEAEAGATPLEHQLDALSRNLVWITLGIALVIGVAGWIAQREILEVIQISIALAVAAIPEGLPIVATIALARGVWRMAKRKALIVDLAAVETLGATNIILTDKTGTLTENRMTVTHIVVTGSELTLAAGKWTIDGRPVIGEAAERVRQLLATAVLCNNATLVQRAANKPPHAIGDPMETAILAAADRYGIDRQALLRQHPRVAERPFDPQMRAMSTFHHDGASFIDAVKGAPEQVLEFCSQVRSQGRDVSLTGALRQEWAERGHALASQGLRVLAIATRRLEHSAAEPFKELTLLGLIGLEDPAREGVRDALAACRDSGIRVVMVTGDHAATARHIAEDIGLVSVTDQEQVVADGRTLGPIQQLDAAERERFIRARVVARATPAQKLDLIQWHQDQGQIVAMTGDGVNDAPALKKSNIGVAMGLRGTQVAREAAAMVLQDDRFETIVEAIAQGRAIFANIRKFVIYLLSCNLSEILVVGIATAAGAPLPLLPLQILFLNLVTDVFPALALGVGEGGSTIMSRGPRPSDQPMLDQRHWRLIVIHGVLMAVVVLLAMAAALLVLDLDRERAVTVSFLTLALSQLWHVFNMRDDRWHPLVNEITKNPWVWAALALCLLLLLGAVYLPGLSHVLSLADPGASGWAVVLIMSALPVVLGPLVTVRRPAVHDLPGAPETT